MARRHSPNNRSFGKKEAERLRNIPLLAARQELHRMSPAEVKALKDYRTTDQEFDRWYSSLVPHYCSFARPGTDSWVLPIEQICHTLYVNLSPIMAVTTLIDGRRFYHVDRTVLICQALGLPTTPGNGEWLITSEREASDIIESPVHEYIEKLMEAAETRIAAAREILSPVRPVKYRVSYAERGCLDLKEATVCAYTDWQVKSYAEARGFVIMNIEESSA